MRRRSGSLPTTRNGAFDFHEKPSRYNPRPANGRNASKLEKIKAAWMTQSQRSRYLKTGGILLFLVFLFYFFSPKGSAVYDEVANLGGQGGQVPSDPSLGTVKCTKSSDKTKPIIQYVLMIDAGSTGSRIHVYKFNNCGATPELEDEIFKETEKKSGGSGLSSYRADAEGAAKSLDVLMKAAMDAVPDKLKSCTPVAVKATAGLRMLPEGMGDKILGAVRSRLETEYPFPVVSKENNGVIIMDGADEGAYAWITINYLLRKIGGPAASETAAVFDLGGGSTQIVFEPTFKSENFGVPEKLADGEHKYELKFGGRDFDLYQHSHLGYGLMAARNAIHGALIEDIHSQNPDSHDWTTKPIINPCINAGTTDTIKVELPGGHKLGNSLELNMTGPSSPAPAQCRQLAERILVKDAACPLAPCSFNGTHQPSLEKTLRREDIYVISYFYDRVQPLGMPSAFTLNDLQRLTEQVCGGEDSWAVFKNIPDALKELQKKPEYCLDLSYMMALLHTGYEMPMDREVKTAKKLNGNELGWCLGASLPLLAQNSGWTCRIKEVS